MGTVTALRIVNFVSAKTIGINQDVFFNMVMIAKTNSLRL